MNGILIAGLLVALLLYAVLLYNNIIRKRNDVDKAFGSIDAMLKKRYDLIPNLVEVVKQYTSYEESILTEITRTRSQLTNSITDSDKIELHNKLTNQLSGMLFSVENYPNLKANSSFLQLQAAWNEAEEQIAAARRYYNAAVTEYNNSIQTFPANLLVDPNKFVSKKVLEIDNAERQNISAKELFKAN